MDVVSIWYGFPSSVRCSLCKNPTDRVETFLLPPFKRQRELRLHASVSDTFFPFRCCWSFGLRNILPGASSSWILQFRRFLVIHARVTADHTDHYVHSRYFVFKPTLITLVLKATRQHLSRSCHVEHRNQACRTCWTTLQLFCCPGKPRFF